jgi:hypothetical protein
MAPHLSIAFAFLHCVTVHAQLTAEKRAVSVGGCYDLSKDQLLYCAAVDEECDAGIRFRNANELKKLGVLECNTDNLPLGICKSTGQCAITKDSCDDPDEFTREDIYNTGCDAEGTTSNNENFVPTQYGACVDGTTSVVTCVLTPSDCTEKEAWVSANVAKTKKNGGCKCHDVKVGVCIDGPDIDPMLSQCAVSLDDCNPLVQSFGTARNVIDHALLDCRLCPYDESLTSKEDEPPIADSPNETSQEPPVTNENTPEEPPTETKQDPVKSGRERSLSDGAIAALVVVSILCAFAVLFFIRRVRSDPEKQSGERLEDAEII